MGILIAVLVALGFVGGGGVLAAQYAAAKPAEGPYGIRVRYLDKAVKPWPGLPEAIGRCVNLLASLGRLDRGTFWIEVVPDGQPLRMTGHRTAEPGVVGTLRFDSFLAGAIQQPVIVVRQRLLSAGVETAIRSALFHEFAEHFLPWTLEKDLNPNHAEKWKVFTRRLESGQ